MVESKQHDIIIVGGGGAGLRAAIAIAENNPELDVAIVSKVYPMRSHTVSAEGGAAAVTRDNDTFDLHSYDTISGSDWMADQDAVELFVNEAPNELIQLEHWGCPWSRDEDGRVSVRPFGGMKISRTWFASDKTGFHMLHTLFQTSLKYEPITRYDEYFVTKLLVEDGRCQGLAAVEIKSGKVHMLIAKAVILCTGGAGQMFPFTTNGSIVTGDGMGMAYRAGVPLKDMEFIQYHPTGLPGSGLLITEASRGEGGILLNKDGYRYLQDYGMGPPDPWPRLRAMELGPRDKLSQAFIGEMQKGRTIKGPYGDVVHLDIRHLGEEKINSNLPLVRELAMHYAGVDPVHELIPVRPVIHYTMGGISTDINAATPLAGLYAAGEAACVSINGANRLGSNSLTELLVFGKLAGSGAAQFASQQGDPNLSALEKQANTEEKRIQEKFLNTQSGTERVSALRKEMRDAMESGCGIFRDADSLTASRDKLAELRERFADVHLDDSSKNFNTELTAALELDLMLDVAATVVHSALARTESRGSHQRTDYPERDDEKYLRHSMAYPSDDAPRIDYQDVIITRWPPGDRVYGS